MFYYNKRRLRPMALPGASKAEMSREGGQGRIDDWAERERRKGWERWDATSLPCEARRDDRTYKVG